MQLVRAGLRNPVRIEVKVQQRGTKEQQRVPSTYVTTHCTACDLFSACSTTDRVLLIRLSNYYAICESDQRLSQLVSFLLKHRESKIIVFFLTCACVNYFWKALRYLDELKDYSLHSLHGKIPHETRIGTLDLT
jgi:ATP-dependent RNA helicase DDX55/SPB4